MDIIESFLCGEQISLVEDNLTMLNRSEIVCFELPGSERYSIGKTRKTPSAANYTVSRSLICASVIILPQMLFESKLSEKNEKS